MEFCPGFNLKTLLETTDLYVDWQSKFQSSEKTFEQEKQRVAVELIAGVAHLHSIGVFHRDLKMENIMYNGEVKIVDFGEVCFATKFRKKVGTPSVMAPEVAREEFTVSAKADVFTLAAVIYQLMISECCQKSPLLSAS